MNSPLRIPRHQRRLAVPSAGIRANPPIAGLNPDNPRLNPSPSEAIRSYPKLKNSPSMCRVQRLLDRRNDLALDGERATRDARSGRRRMPAAAELGGDVVHVHL